jgi:tetratricopeptide (TPR) repeat protein
MGAGGSKPSRTSGSKVDAAIAALQAPPAAGTPPSPPKAPSGAKTAARTEPAAATDSAEEDQLVILSEKTSASVVAAVDAWNAANTAATKLSGDGAVKALLAAVGSAVPGITTTLGALGEHAPLVGVVFSVLRVAGAHVAATGATRRAYEALAAAVNTTTRLVLQVEAYQQQQQQQQPAPTPLPPPVQAALAQYWAQLDAFAALLVEFRGANYAQRLWSQGAHQARLTAIRDGLERARTDLTQVSALVGTVQLGRVLDLQAESSSQLQLMLAQQAQATAQLHDALSGIAALRAEAAARRRDGDGRVWTLPAAARDFVGRTAELATLHALLVPAETGAPAPRVVVAGAGGTGKSALAYAAAERDRDRFSNAWLLDGSNEATVRAGMSLVADDLALPLGALPAAVAAQLETPERQGWLLVVDNVNTADMARRLPALLPRTGGCIVVTSRLASLWPTASSASGTDVDTTGTTWRVLHLAVLSTAEALQLLPAAPPPAPAAPTTLVSTAEDEDAARAAVAQRLGGLPQALATATIYLRRQGLSWSAYLAKLDEGDGDAAAATPSGSPLRAALSSEGLAATDAGAVARALRLSLQAVVRERPSPAVAVLLQLVQVLHADAIPRALLTAAATRVTAPAGDGAAAEVDGALALLVDYAIVWPVDRAYVGTARLLQAAMRTSAPCPPAVAAALVAQLHEYVDTALVSRDTSKASNNNRNDAAGDREAWLRALRVQFDELLPWLERTMPDSAALADALETAARVVADGLGHAADAVELLIRTVAVQERLHGPNDVRLVPTLLALARAYCARAAASGAGADTDGAADTAAEVAALQRAQMVQQQGAVGGSGTLRGSGAGGGLTPEAVPILLALADACGRSGDYAAQRNHAERALAVQERVGSEPAALLPTLTLLGTAQVALGRLDDARRVLERALVLGEGVWSAGPGSALVPILTALGICYTQQQAHHKAQTVQERALALEEARLGRDDVQLAPLLAALGNSYGAVGDPRRKQALLERALALREQQWGMRHARLASTLTELAEAATDLGDTARAQELQARARALHVA